MTDTEAGTPLTTCGHPFPCAPSDDGQCDHVDGNGVHQGYAYRCLLVPHGNTRHFHDRRPVAREWFERSTGTHAVLADAARSRPATDPAGLPDHGFAADRPTGPRTMEGHALARNLRDRDAEVDWDAWIRSIEDAAARLSVADGPGPEERLRAALAEWDAIEGSSLFRAIIAAGKMADAIRAALSGEEPTSRG